MSFERLVRSCTYPPTTKERRPNPEITVKDEKGTYKGCRVFRAELDFSAFSAIIDRSVMLF